MMGPCRRRCLPVLLAIVLFTRLLSSAQIREARNVLMVEDQISAPAIEAVARVLEADIIARSPDPILFFRESLDTFLIPEGDYQGDVRKWYEKKYSQRKLDLIVTLGPASHDFPDERALTILSRRAGGFPTRHQTRPRIHRA